MTKHVSEMDIGETTSNLRKKKGALFINRDRRKIRIYSIVTNNDKSVLKAFFTSGTEIENGLKEKKTFSSKLKIVSGFPKISKNS